MDWPADDHSMIEPLTRWTCDICGRDVSRSGGLLTVQTEDVEPFRAYGFRIVHRSNCQPGSGGDTNGGDLSIDGNGGDNQCGGDNTVAEDLQAYLGANGFSRALAYLTAGPGRAGEEGLAVRDVDEFIDLIRRLHTPFYEQARRLFSDPVVTATLRADDRWHPYQPANLRRISEPARAVGLWD